MTETFLLKNVYQQYRVQSRAQFEAEIRCYLNRFEANNYYQMQEEKEDGEDGDG